MENLQDAIDHTASYGANGADVLSNMFSWN